LICHGELMIRDALMTDIPRLCEILEAMHSKTIYAEQGHSIDKDRMKAVLMQSIQSHMFKPFGDFLAKVSENKGVIEGFIIGASAPVYLIGEKNMVTDLFWVATDKVNPHEPIKLMKNLIAWGKVKPDVIEVRCGATPIVQSPIGAGNILKRLGLKPYGDFYRKEV
jgi:hypothetical protein